ncbi:DUF3592 domain-containing protein [Streptomyces sp. NPDC051907]|uniref:DUF3592 domain-containing protein n=1 Tax=Streptomyces sp. NPDC051907 TaxID=3155284 RepID=UPI00343A9F70
MDRLLLIVPGLIAAGCVAVMALAVVRMRRLRAAWNSGVAVPGRCLSSYAGTRRRQGSGATAHHHVYEFFGPDGLPVRFDEAGGPATIAPGDTVVIRYPAGRPDRATAIPPSHGRVLAATGVVLVLGSLMIAGAVAFMAGYDVDHGVDGPSEQVDESPADVPSDLPSDFLTEFPADLPSDFPYELLPESSIER